MTTVTIKGGNYRGKEINGTYPMVREWKNGAKGGFVTVTMNDATTRINCTRKQITVNASAEVEVDAVETGALNYEAQVRANETEQDAMDRIARSFDIVTMMTKGAVEGSVRGMVISGPPGIGKSFGVEETLREANTMHRLKKGLGATDGDMYDIVKGACTPIALYQKLYMNRDKGQVVVFDDCDSVLADDLMLNLLKAALDSSKRRMISWNAESRVLREAEIPDSFEFRGSVIFLTNLSFDNVRSAKLKPHLDALKSRVLYLDMDINNQRDMLLRIKQIVRDGLLEEYDFEKHEEESIVSFVMDNANDLRELSLRTVIKAAGLYKTTKTQWQELGVATLLRPEAKWKHYAQA